MRRFFRNNGLSIAMLGFFFPLLLLMQSLAGHRQYNEDAREHGRAELSYVHYLESPHFLEATAENWESEFLQMFIYVALTACLYQKGSSESKDPDNTEGADSKPSVRGEKAPWPVRRGGWILRVYQNSLSLAFLALFLISLAMHAVGGAKTYEQEQREHGKLEPVSALSYMRTSRFWFESFQNWQSEFLAIGSMVVLSIWLRQKGSPESKRVEAPHDQTGR